MPMTLGIDDEDSVDVVRDIESSFGIVISNSEAEACRTLGDVHQLVLKRFRESGRDGRFCASAMAFYRLRQVLARDLPKAKLRPSTRLSVVMKQSAKRLFRDAHAQTGLRLPKAASSWVGWVGSAGAVVGLLGALPVGIFFGGWFVVPLAAAMVGFLLIRLDPGRFPKDCETLGGLATKVSKLNVGHLATAGARVSDDELWSSLTEVMSQYSSVPAADMRPEALLRRGQREAA